MVPTYSSLVYTYNIRRLPTSTSGNCTTAKVNPRADLIIRKTWVVSIDAMQQSGAPRYEV